MVGPEAEFAGQGDAGAGLDTVDAEAVKLDVFGVDGRVAGVLDQGAAGARGRAYKRPRQIPGQGVVGGGKREVRQARVVVDVVERRLGIVQLFDHAAQGQAILAPVGRRFGAARGDIEAGAGHLRIGQGLGQVERAAARLDHVAGGEKCPAAVEHTGPPVVLVEAFQVQRVADAEAEGEHLHRQLTFLELDTRLVEGRDIQRVDHVDAVLDQQRLAPGQHLLAELHRERPLGHLEVLPEVGVEYFEALELRQVRPAGIIEAVLREGPALGRRAGIVEARVAVRIGIVVPVLEAHEGALAVTVEAEVGDALGDLRNGVALLEVEAVVIGADAHAVGHHALRHRSVGAGHQVQVGVFQGPAGTEGQSGLGAQAPVFVDLDAGGLGRRAQRREHGQGERLQRVLATIPVSQMDVGSGRACSCHCVLRGRNGAAWPPCRRSCPRPQAGADKKHSGRSSARPDQAEACRRPPWRVEPPNAKCDQACDDRRNCLGVMPKRLRKARMKLLGWR
ncbi:hypothetical protein D3C84_569970 [compost metagenome]